MNFKIGDRVFVRGHIDEIRKDTVIIRNNGGYFGTIPSEVITGELPSAQPEITEEAVKEYCRKRNLCVIDSELLKKYAYEVVVLTIFGPFLCKN